ncbi:hypothetical protein [Ramlibacter sp. Leaf400]|uniref:hypothetical protein n=1 Tax=Ramlibacter sp. Leaf400 TaxID=1736365 RepID=UPI0006F5D54C|nr:hypothetical protein [Ramlibacter sp. Leaf400]KQT13462.1 hypothetical protein ASG30_18715 [Ramlibacter sp. Leaf400]
METLEVLERVQGIADSVHKAQPSRALWKLVAREPSGRDSRELPLASYRAGRTLALELSELGLMVSVVDPDQRVRLSIWPPRLE